MAWTHPPPHAQYRVGRGGEEGGAAADLVKQVEPLGQESLRAKLLEWKDSSRREESGGESLGRHLGT